MRLRGWRIVMVMVDVVRGTPLKGGLADKGVVLDGEA